MTAVPPSTGVDLTDCAPATRTFRVCLPGGPPKVDVYLLADTTGSMGGALNSVQTSANTLLTALLGYSTDLQVAVGNYKDFPDSGYCFQHQLGPSNVAATIAAAIAAWSASGGSDVPEGQFFALHEIATSGTIGWRPGAKRIIVWFGDAPAHDPVCAAINGTTTTITEALVTSALQATGTTVFAISLPAGGTLDGDPVAGSTDYGLCGTPGGMAAQATRITAATGGVHTTLANAATLPATIMANVSGSVNTVDISLRATAPILPFVADIQPPVHQGVVLPTDPLLQVCVDFTVTFQPGNTAGTFAGVMEGVVNNGNVAASLPYSVTAVACCTAPPPNMVGWWHDVTATDLAGPAFNHGTWNLPALASTGYVGTSGLQHASTHFVTVPHHASLDFDANRSFSIDLWVKPDTVFAGLQPLVCKTSYGPAWFHYSGYAFYLDHGRPALVLASAGNHWTWVANSTVVPADVWSHLAVTVDRVNPAGRFYLDGVQLIDTFVPVTDTLANQFPVMLGNFNHAFRTTSNGQLVGGSGPFDGETDEIELFRRALTPAEVAAIHGAGHAGKCQDGLPGPFPIWDRDVGPLLLRGDDTLALPVRLPFPFPFPRVVGPDVYVHVSTNGFLYLGSSATAPGNANGYSTNPTTLANNLRNGPPRIAPYWKDLNLVAARNGGVHLKFATNPNRAVITWLNAVEFGQSVTKTIQCQLFENGMITFYFSQGMTVTTGTGLCGVSAGGGDANPGASDLSAGPLAATPTVYEVFNPSALPFDLAGTGVAVVPHGNGFEVLPDAVPVAQHVTRGSGCYQRAACFYELFPAGGFDLAQGSLQLLPSGSGYLVTQGGTGFVTPSGAAVGLGLTDDSQATWSLPGTFAYPGGSTDSLAITSNGYLWLQPDASVDFTPTTAELVSGTARLAPVWCDLVPDGANNVANVFVETIGNRVLVTWLDCPVFGNAGTVTAQVTLDLATGIVEYHWQGATPGLASLTGYAPGGGTLDPGNRDLSTAAPFVTEWPERAALALSAAPDPVLGSTFDYTIANIPPAGLASVMLLSLTAQDPGLDLSAFGAPGCQLLLGSPMIVHGMAFGTPSVRFSLSLPQTPSLAGLPLSGQGAALVPGENAAGLLTSNAIASTLQLQ